MSQASNANDDLCEDESSKTGEGGHDDGALDTGSSTSSVLGWGSSGSWGTEEGVSTVINTILTDPTYVTLWAYEMVPVDDGAAVEAVGVTVMVLYRTVGTLRYC